MVFNGPVERHGERKFISYKTIEKYKMCGKFCPAPAWLMSPHKAVISVTTQSMTNSTTSHETPHSTPRKNQFPQFHGQFVLGHLLI